MPYDPRVPYHQMPYPTGASSAAAITSAAASAAFLDSQKQNNDIGKIAALEAEVASLRIKNSWLMEETQRFGHTDSKEKIAVLAELNDKLELDLDLALKELSLNKRKADSREAQLIKVQGKNSELELELANLKAGSTRAEKQSASKRDWAEKRLKEEEATIYDLQNQLRLANAALTNERAEHEETKRSYSNELKKQYALIETMKETYRKKLAEAEDGRLTAARQSRAIQNAQASEVFHAFDTNGDGVMDEAEFAAAFAQFAKPKHSPFPAPDSPVKRFDYQKSRYVAMFDCQPDSADELSFKEGDVVEVVGEGDVGWFIAMINDQKGMVPSNYLKPVRA